MFWSRKKVAEPVERDIYALTPEQQAIINGKVEPYQIMGREGYKSNCEVARRITFAEFMVISEKLRFYCASCNSLLCTHEINVKYIQCPCCKTVRKNPNRAKNESTAACDCEKCRMGGGS